ncbi:zinc finger BED domain-containing protein 6-like [Mantella aurantiaca]
MALNLSSKENLTTRDIEMSPGKKNQAMEAEPIPSLHQEADLSEVDFVEVQCPANNESDFKRVPEIEIKLGSSDEEEDRSEESSTCSAPPQKRLLVPTPSRAFAAGHGTGLCEDDGSLSSMTRPIRKRKSTSEVWQFFSRSPTNICRAICGLCKMSVSRGKLGGNFGTTALKRHLECKHPLEWAQRKSMRLQRAELAEEEEETCEDEEEKDEAYQNPANRAATGSPDSPQMKDCSFVCSQEPASPKTYEIIDSSEEEEERGDHLQGQCEEGIERKRKKCEDFDSEMFPVADFTIGAVGPPGASHRLGNAQPSGSLTFTIPDYSAVPLGARRRKSISAVWQFFCLDRTNICRAICTLCQTSVSRGKMGGHFGTSALMRHLEGKHPLEWGRGKFNKLNVANAIEVDDEEDEEMDESVMYPEGPFSHFGPADISLYPDMTNAMSQMHYTVPVEYNIEGEEPLMDGSSISLPFPSFKGTFAAPTNVKMKPGGRYPPNHLKAQSWNRNITELMCEMALPYSFISSKAFHKFMGRADPQYSVPTKSFFSKKAVPQLYEAVCENIVSELKRSACPYIHITAHVWSGDLAAYYLSLTAHWSVMNPDADQPAERKYAVLSIKRFPKEFTEISIQQELIRQANRWLTAHALSAGFFISNRDFNLVQAIKGANCTYIPCFTHSLNLLVKDFLQSNRYIAGMLAVARKVCGHFIHSARARRILAELQYQNNLPKQCLKPETATHWTSTFYMLQRLLEQQKAVQAYFLMHTADRPADVLLNPSHWNLMLSLVDLLQPFEMATREVNSNTSCLSQVLPELRYLHIFLKKIRGHFESAGDANGAVIADSLALKLSTDCGVNETFRREEYVLATLLDPRFKGRIEAILPPDSDIDHWKQVLVKKVKEVMASSNPSPHQAGRTSYPFGASGGSEAALFPGKPVDLEAGGPPWRRSMEAAPLIHKEKSLIEHLESVGLLASKSTGASLSTESHSACVMVEKYLQDNKTIGAKDDPLTYWQKRAWLWPSLTQLAIMYLTCPSSGIFAERVFSFHRALADRQRHADVMEGMESVVFLKVNLENFPNYNPPPLIFSSDNEAEPSDSDNDGL